MEMKIEELRSKVGEVRVPELGGTLAELKMLKRVESAGDSAVTVELELPTPAYPGREQLQQTVQQAVKEVWPEVEQVEVQLSHKVAANQNDEKNQKLGLKVKNVIAVGSGKGGVGKSMVSAALALGLQQFGAKVGLLDADVYGPSVPHLLGVQANPSVVEFQTPDGQTVHKLKPIEFLGLEVLSIGFLIQEHQAVIWRGPMLHSAMTQFLKDTAWSELDYLIIDLPPGTGDVSISLSQLVSLSGAVVVCTPQKLALLDAVKAVTMFRQVNVPVLGMVENMSGELFGRGGTRAKAEELNVPFLGEIPTLPEIRVKCDEGRISELFDPDSPAREPLLQVCQQVALQAARQALSSHTAKSFEV